MSQGLKEKTERLNGTEVDPVALDSAIEGAQNYLLRRQNPQGCWAGMLETDASVTAAYIPLMYFMNGYISSERREKIINYLKRKQQNDGSWNSYYGGLGDVSISIQVYFAMKLAGVSAAEPFMRSAKAFILSQGGLTKANVYTMMWLAIFGQVEWKLVPSIAPELVLLPRWLYSNIYECAGWSWKTLIALMIVLTTKPVCKIPDFGKINDLYMEIWDERKYTGNEIGRFFRSKSFFLFADLIYKLYEKLPIKPGRSMAIRRLEKWVLKYQEKDGSWGGIMLPWVYALIGLKSLGYAADHPAISRGMSGLEGFINQNDEIACVAPATSPVGDTAWTIIALQQSGVASDHPSLAKAARWLMKKEILTNGGLYENNRVETWFWSFESPNLYPDIDQSVVVPRALLRVILPPAEEKNKNLAVKRVLDWTLALQSSNRSWAAFDRDRNKEFRSHIPFADFITPLDPASSDVTAQAVGLLGEIKWTNPLMGKSIRVALTHLKKIQKFDGAWYGSRGVNYLYGTGMVLMGLRASGENMSKEYVLRAVNWIKLRQNSDGGWGEACGTTYDEPCLRGTGSSTASQTAWALMGLLAAGQGDSPQVKRGTRYLVKNQTADGSWKEDEYTGTGFSRAFYLRYDFYRVYFPLIALAQYRDEIIR